MYTRGQHEDARGGAWRGAARSKEVGQELDGLGWANAEPRGRHGTGKVSCGPEPGREGRSLAGVGTEGGRLATVVGGFARLVPNTHKLSSEN